MAIVLMDMGPKCGPQVVGQLLFEQTWDPSVDPRLYGRLLFEQTWDPNVGPRLWGSSYFLGFLRRMLTNLGYGFINLATFYKIMLQKHCI